MTLSNTDKKRFRQIGHQLTPIVTIASKGLTDNIRNEIDRALTDHELIKIKINGVDREEKKALGKSLCTELKADCVQQIGHVMLLYRAAKKPDPRLSNLIRPLQ